MFDGVDGLGKTTQINLAKAKLESAGKTVAIFRNLGGTPIGEAIREVMLSPLPRPASSDTYMSVAIQEALIDQIDKSRTDNPDLVVLMDRCPLSLAAYQAYGSGMDKDLVWRYVDDGMKRLKPDMVLIFEGEIDTALERARQVSGKEDYFESKPHDYFERVVAGFQEGARRYDARSIDADQSIDGVQADVMNLIDHLFA